MIYIAVIVVVVVVEMSEIIVDAKAALEKRGTLV